MTMPNRPNKPQRRKLAHVMVTVGWRDQVFECELEVSDEADWAILAELLNQAYGQVRDRLIEHGEALDREADAEQDQERITLTQSIDTIAQRALDQWNETKAEIRNEPGPNVGPYPLTPESVPGLVQPSSGDHAECRDPQCIRSGRWVLCETHNTPETAMLMRGAKPPQLSPLAPGALDDYAKADVDPEGFVRDEKPQSDLPARGGQCRAIVVRQKRSGEVRESCGWTLFPDGSCNNAAAHLQGHEVTASEVAESGDSPRESAKERLAREYTDRFGVSPDETMTMESMRAALKRP